MGQIWEGLKNAIDLIIRFDQEVYKIILLTIKVSFTSTLIATMISVPSGIALGINDFKGKNIVVRFLYTMMSLPPVIVGLLIFLILSRSGPLGDLKLSYTPVAMIIAQTCLVTPVITGIIYNGTKRDGKKIQAVGKVLGANELQVLILLIKELRVHLFTGVVSGYGRAISEVGAVMMVGGNIKGYTRVMTTAIAMHQSMGDYSMSFAIGIILLAISFIVNSILYHYQQGE